MTVRVRVTKVDEFQFLTCLKHGLWGSASARFKDWERGDYLVFTENKTLAALARVSGDPFQSRERVWDNGLYPHRIPLDFTHALLPEHRPPILGEVRDALTSAWGLTYGWGIVNQRLLPEPSGEILIRAATQRPNDKRDIESRLDQLLAEAKASRDAASGRKRRSDGAAQATGPTQVAAPPESDAREEPPATSEDETQHRKAQYALIRLGKITGCSVWIAANDRNRMYRGKALGTGCLHELPNLGLNREAMNRIGLIDVIWVRQNAPVCAFEVETTTAVYSGLLRMSDLMSVVPALSMKLYVVAPQDRQDKVMGELSRPTFQKIGLSEFCRYVSTEKLEGLVERLEGLGGIQPQVIDSIAVELEDLAGTAT